ncbi:MAG: penicillin-binding protein 2 [Chthoniobacteraceae bacterium]|nr:penicillin-binding protein 2 [Chthoniobacteraceae bacterium]
MSFLMFRRIVFFSSLVTLCLPGGPLAAQDEPIKPTLLTEKYARTYTLKIPAPRGQIVDRNGEPLAVTRVCQNLGINFPTPLDYPDAKAVAFARGEIEKAERILGRKFSVQDKTIERHYRNRGILPFDILQDVSAADLAALKGKLGEGLVLHPMYVRSYPNGAVAAHILGYAGRSGPQADGPVENNEPLWTDAKGSDGLESAFNEQLTGKPGQLTIHFDAKGKKDYEKVTVPPQPGYTVVTTLDLRIQKLCEKALEKGVKRGALVFIDPNTGDILAMASWPTFDPNVFIPAPSPEQFKALNDNPNHPLLSRAFRSTYPPGSTFKTFVGIAAMESGTIKPDDQFPGPPAISVGNLTMRNWKKTDAGDLDLAGALEQSCNTWFFHVGIKTGAKSIIDWAQRFGFGAKTGIPLRYEADGLVPTNEYLKKKENRRFSDGDVANFAIGQGYLLVTPLQMAQAMATVGNGGTLYQTRLVLQVQGLDEKVITPYDIRIKDEIEMKSENFDAVKKGLRDVVTGSHATGSRADVENADVAGKTGTAQWGPKSAERNAAWFTGFAPADAPKYAFAALYESDVNQGNSHGGTVAAPLVAQVLKELYKDEAKPQKHKRSKPEPTPAPAEEEGAGD